MSDIRVDKVEKDIVLGTTRVTAFRPDTGSVTVTLLSSVVDAGHMLTALRHALDRKAATREAIS